MSEWISVEDRMPETDILSNINSGCVIVTDGSEVWEEFVDHMDYARKCGGVTHWMPLPEPPNA